jgi:hypothetical protein
MLLLPGMAMTTLKMAVSTDCETSVTATSYTISYSRTLHFNVYEDSMYSVLACDALSFSTFVLYQHFWKTIASANPTRHDPGQTSSWSMRILADEPFIVVTILGCSVEFFLVICQRPKRAEQKLVVTMFYRITEIKQQLVTFSNVQIK